MEIDAITWEAAATLITGICAVGAAIYVGGRQAGITATQATIQREQTLIQMEQTAIQGEVFRLEQLKLKADLYERRLEVYNAARAYLAFMFTSGKVPAMDNDGEGKPIALDIYQAFISAMGAGEFLLGDKANAEIKKLWDTSTELAAAKDEMEGLAARPFDDPEQGAEEEDGSKGKARLQASRRVMRARKALADHYDGLRIAFEDDLKLTLPSKDRETRAVQEA